MESVSVFLLLSRTDPATGSGATVQLTSFRGSAAERSDAMLTFHLGVNFGVK